MINAKLQNLYNIKNDIGTAIVNKGGTITESTPFYSYAGQIDNISTGGGAYSTWAIEDLSGKKYVPYIKPQNYVVSSVTNNVAFDARGSALYTQHRMYDNRAFVFVNKILMLWPPQSDGAASLFTTDIYFNPGIASVHSSFTGAGYLIDRVTSYQNNLYFSQRNSQANSDRIFYYKDNNASFTSLLFQTSVIVNGTTQTLHSDNEYVYVPYFQNITVLRANNLVKVGDTGNFNDWAYAMASDDTYFYGFHFNNVRRFYKSNFQYDTNIISNIGATPTKVITENNTFYISAANRIKTYNKITGGFITETEDVNQGMSSFDIDDKYVYATFRVRTASPTAPAKIIKYHKENLVTVEEFQTPFNNSWIGNISVFGDYLYVMDYQNVYRFTKDLKPVISLTNEIDYNSWVQNNNAQEKSILTKTTLLKENFNINVPSGNAVNNNIALLVNRPADIFFQGNTSRIIGFTQSPNFIYISFNNNAQSFFTEKLFKSNLQLAENLIRTNSLILSNSRMFKNSYFLKDDVLVFINETSGTLNVANFGSLYTASFQISPDLVNTTYGAITSISDLRNSQFVPNPNYIGLKAQASHSLYILNGSSKITKTDIFPTGNQLFYRAVINSASAFVTFPNGSSAGTNAQDLYVDKDYVYASTSFSNSIAVYRANDLILVNYFNLTNGQQNKVTSDETHFYVDGRKINKQTFLSEANASTAYSFNQQFVDNSFLYAFQNVSGIPFISKFHKSNMSFISNTASISSVSTFSNPLYFSDNDYIYVASTTMLEYKKFSKNTYSNYSEIETYKIQNTKE
jgi:hypothetical protein